MKTTSYGRQALDTVMTLRPTDVDAVPWQPVPGCPGVLAKDLWRAGDLHDALISYEPGAGTPGHPHAGAHHYIWVVSGSAAIAGRHVTAGSYIHVPPGVAHPVADVGEMGCLLLQMHRPLPTDRPA